MGKATTKSGLAKSPVDLARLVPLEQMSGDSKKDTLLLREMATEAREFLLSFKWCRNVRRSWFGWGVGGVCAVFFFEISPTSKKTDKWLWVIVGDLPPAYLVVDASPTPLEALGNYADLVEEWVESVKAKRPVNDCIPVNAAATRENANLLQRRLDFIRKEFLGRKPRIRRKLGLDSSMLEESEK